MMSLGIDFWGGGGGGGPTAPSAPPPTTYVYSMREKLLELQCVDQNE